MRTNERESLWGMLNRASALGDRLASKISQRIKTRTNLQQLDSLFKLAERNHALYLRIYARYEAARPESLRDLWND